MKRNQRDWQNAFGAPDASFDARFHQTLEQLREDKPMKKVTIRAAVIAVALALLVTAAAFALSGMWDVGGYLSNRYGIDVPEGFVSQYGQTLTQTVGGVEFTVRDAYIERDYLYMIARIAPTDGQKALFVGAGASKEDTIDNLYLDGREDGRTIAQYAKDNDLNIIDVSMGVSQGVGFNGGMDFWLEEDGSATCVLTANDLDIDGDAAAFAWSVRTRQEGGEWQEAQTDVTLPVYQGEKYEIAVGKAVEGTAVVIDKLTAYKGKLGLSFDVHFHIDMNAPKEQRDLAADALWFEIIDPMTGEKLPGGASLEGSIESNNKIGGFLQRGLSLSMNWQGEEITLRAYDCWEKDRFGSVTVSIEKK